jgi:ATP/maltotriose-dependent transcriptional regulator MalT
MGERGFLPTIAGFLAQALYAEGNYDEAEYFSRASEAAAAADDVPSQVIWRSARAKVLARRGDLGQAERLSREAVEIAEATDLFNAQGNALSDLAEVLAVAGRAGEAAAVLIRAAERFERKGNLTSLENADRAARKLAARLETLGT